MTQQYVSLGTYSTEMGMYVHQKTVEDAKKKKKWWGRKGWCGDVVAGMWELQGVKSE